MRLICPNCDAQYEVDEAAIPAAGRDVQCSNCGHTWFQLPANAPMSARQDDTDLNDNNDEDGDDYSALVSADDENDDEPPAAQAENPRRRELDDAVLDVLREEADRETRARKGEALESQPDLGLEEAAAGGAAIRSKSERMARLRGIAESVQEKPASRRELLPDIEEINSTLRSSSDRTDLEGGEILDESDLPQRRSGFGFGFGLVVLVAGLLVLAYVLAPAISAKVPQAAPILASYVEWVDAQRAAATLWIETMTSKLQEANDG